MHQFDRYGGLRTENTVSRGIHQDSGLTLMSAEDVQRAVARMAHQIAERNKGVDDVSLIGIVNRGQYIAQRLAAKLEELEGVAPPLGRIDCVPFRDDVDVTARKSVEHDHSLAELVRDRCVVLVDDVLNTGRTARAAMEAIVSVARPSLVQLTVLVDRGRRELPIKADFVGKNAPSAAQQHVSVMLQEVDGRDCVKLESDE